MIIYGIFQLERYKGLNLYFNNSQNLLINDTIKAIIASITIVQSESNVTQIQLYSTQSSILSRSKDQLHKVQSILAMLHSSANSSANISEADTISSTVASFSTILQSLGTMSNNYLSCHHFLYCLISYLFYNYNFTFVVYST